MGVREHWPKKPIEIHPLKISGYHAIMWYRGAKGASVTSTTTDTITATSAYATALRATKRKNVKTQVVSDLVRSFSPLLLSKRHLGTRGWARGSFDQQRPPVSICGDYNTVAWGDCIVIVVEGEAVACELPIAPARSKHGHDVLVGEQVGYECCNWGFSCRQERLD